MQITNYTTQTEDSGRITVHLQGKVVSKGFFDTESALHSIWVLEGKNPKHFYHEKDGDVYLEVREDETKNLQSM